jgi:tetrapyrrole methylase family protein/MazG family protein
VTGRIVVGGLGPAGPALVTASTLEAIAEHPHRRLRTARHPAAELAAPAESFDHVYDDAGRLDEVYPTIVEELLADATVLGTVLYLVPGSPLVAERTVELLLAQDEVAITILPALSFLDLAWARLGLDPVAAGVRIVDGHRFATEAAGVTGPMLVGQCDSAGVLSDIKLAVDLEDPPDVTVLQGLGTPDERVSRVAWNDLDRVVEPDHLTSLWIPPLIPSVAGELQRLVELVARLRRECPWDREQTHQSLTRHLVEESYEVLDAIDGLDGAPDTGFAHLQEELGDLLFQVVFHATLAAEAGEFTLAEVAGGIHDKLVLRHPHVFDQVAVDGADEVVANWEAIKKREKDRESVFDGVPRGLPALLRAFKVLRKAEATALVGAPDPAGLVDRAEAVASEPGPDAVGDLLVSVVEQARRAGVDPEESLRRATDRLEADLRRAERDQAG